jgi:carbonic anhydrase
MPTAKILAGIGQFHDHFEERRDLFDRLATEGQSPDVLFISCSDSRVVPELLTGAEPGDLFVIRSVGNLVPPYGVGEMGVGTGLEYALRHVGVRHLILCGHTDCGGIKALDAPPDWSREPHLARWIEHARPARTRIEASGIPAEERHLATVRENVLLQLEHLRTYDPVREGERAGTLTLHGWVYRLETGTIEAYDEATATWTPLPIGEDPPAMPEA